MEPRKTDFTWPDASMLREAMERIRPWVHHTPLLRSDSLNALSEASLYFKCENFQKTGSFKFRGATNTLEQLTVAERQFGVATHSSGNHAQALALAARQRGIKAMIVMPENAPAIKVAAVKTYGGEIRFCAPNLQARETTLEQLQKKYNPVLVHPYNDYRIISGQASCCIEILHQMPQPEYIVCPVGGGGLLSGTLLAAHYFAPSTKVIAAEPDAANDAWQSWQNQRLILAHNPETIADGLKTSLGSLTWPIIRSLVSEVLTVSETSIAQAMRLIWERMKIVAEPSAAVSLAAVLQNQALFRAKRVAVILSGGNTDLNNLPW